MKVPCRVGKCDRGPFNSEAAERMHYNRVHSKTCIPPGTKGGNGHATNRVGTAIVKANVVRRSGLANMIQEIMSQSRDPLQVKDIIAQLHAKKYETKTSDAGLRNQIITTMKKFPDEVTRVQKGTYQWIGKRARKPREIVHASRISHNNGSGTNGMNGDSELSPEIEVTLLRRMQLRTSEVVMKLCEAVMLASSPV